MINTITTSDLGITPQQIRIAHALNRTSFYPLHKHSGFCELYILLKGTLLHYINDSMTLIHGPSLIFIRESDTHRIQSQKEDTCLFYLVKIHNDTYKDLINYINTPEMFGQLDTYKESPVFPLHHQDYLYIERLIHQITCNIPQDQSLQQLNYRTFLMNIFALILPQLLPSESQIMTRPSWFNHLLEDARHKSVFVKGVPELIKRSGKSNPYLCKCFNKYLNMTPSRFINNLRLSYARTLLADSDLAIVDISLECGYENLSHFYHLFSNEFHTSPNKYRQSKNDIYI